MILVVVAVVVVVVAAIVIVAGIVIAVVEIIRVIILVIVPIRHGGTEGSNRRNSGELLHPYVEAIPGRTGRSLCLESFPFSHVRSAGEGPDWLLHPAPDAFGFVGVVVYMGVQTRARTKLAERHFALSLMLRFILAPLLLQSCSREDRHA